MDSVLTRIDEWQQAGLLDAASADRLRAAERARSATDVVAASEPAALVDRRPRRTLSTVFGPGVTVGEMFAYLGVAFLLAAWTAFVARLAGEDRGEGATIGFGFAVAADVLVLIGFVLRTGEDRRQRAAGVALLAALGDLAEAITAVVAPGH
jgi:hypothetical protein